VKPLVVAALVAAVLAPPPPAQADSSPSCLGRPATPVSTHHGNVVGTSGPDVIVVTDPRRIDAGAGDDLVCVSFTKHRYLKVFLGAGSDRFLGGGSDLAMMRVETGDRDDVALGRAPSHDEVTTGGDSDEVHTGVPGFADDDVVDEGSGGDSLIISGLPVGSFTAAVPPPGQSNLLALDDPGLHAWQVDEENGTVSIDHGTATPLAGFTDLRLSRLTWSSLDITGTDRRDYVDAGHPAGTRGPLTARLGEGRDSIDLDGALTGSVDLGAGTDGVLITGLHAKTFEGDLVARLHGTWSLDGRAGVTLAGVEGMSTYGFLRAEVTGTPGRNSISLSGCGGSVRGGGDRDLLSVEFDHGCPRMTAYSLSGGPGDDRLFGTRSRDVLVGGPGTDVACGGGGRDTIRVERVLARC